MERDYVNRCGECKWFDPVYDKCLFYEAIRVDDFACMEFQLTEGF